MGSDSQSPSADEALLVLLRELLTTPQVTSDHLERRVRKHPELLGATAQSYLSVIAELQSSSVARDQVKNLARILARLQTESVDAVTSDEVRRLRTQSATRLREARMQLARDTHRAPKERRSPRFHGTLPSLAERVAYLRAISAAEPPLPHGRDVLNTRTESHPVPRFLFRGENELFPATSSSLARLRSSAARRVIEDIDRISNHVQAAFQERWQLTRAEALGFLQHYCFPTDFIDVTADPTVAAFFASELQVGEEGSLCVVPTKRLDETRDLVDLRRHPLAQRPRKQSAFAIHGAEHPDLKRPTTVEALELEWLPFRLTEADAAEFGPQVELLDARSDPVAGLLWLLIDDFGKFGDGAAAELAKRIAPAPFSVNILNHGRAQAIAADKAAPERAVNDDDFRRNRYELWSEAFVRPDTEPFSPKLLTDDLRPGTIATVLTPRGLEILSPDRRRP